MGDGDGLRVREVLAGPGVGDPGSHQSIEWGAGDGRFVAEVLQSKHLR